MIQTASYTHTITQVHTGMHVYKHAYALTFMHMDLHTFMPSHTYIFTTPLQYTCMHSKAVGGSRRKDGAPAQRRLSLYGVVGVVSSPWSISVFPLGSN